MTIRRFVTVAVSAALTAFAFSHPPQPAMAAVINWGSAQNITGASDVLTTGTLFASANFGGATVSNITVNGVQFDAFSIVNGGTSQTVGNITLSGTSDSLSTPNLWASGTTLGGPASYNGLLSQTAFLTGTAPPPTLGVTIGGLTTGASYLIQYWVNDGRTSPTNFSNRTTIIGGVTLDVNVSGASGGFGQYIVGTFTADSATQSFNALAGSAGRVDANAMQVRLLAVPEPSTVAVMGAAGGMATMLRLRRSRRAVAPATAL